MSPDIDIAAINANLESESPAEILKWACRTFNPGKIAATSSFQTQSLPFLHIISQVAPDLSVLFIDTGFHFPETLSFRDQLAREFGLNIKNLRPSSNPSSKSQRGELYHRDPDLCCFINKVKPLRDAKLGLDAWITGIRRDQTEARSDTPILGVDEDGLYKISPMASWRYTDIWAYIHEHQLPEHPLHAQGYLSIGCAPCTRPVSLGEDERAGRWADRAKTECGLHIPIPIEDKSVDS
jgi:phosphoadenosine phosphosulfate reductase